MLFYQPEFGYSYNSDSVFLSDFIAMFKPKNRVLDVGAGCGVVGLLVAKKHDKISLEAVERDGDFAEYATINARVNGICYKIYTQDFLEFRAVEKYDFIVSNPPFYHDGAQKSSNNSLLSARYTQNLPLDKFFKKVSQVLKPNSHFIFCYEASQFGFICQELQRVKMRAVDVRFVHSRDNKNASLVMIHAKNGTKSLMKILPPLVVYNGKSYTKEVEEIYKKIEMQSIKCQIQ